jgi:hypothetical protein
MRIRCINCWGIRLPTASRWDHRRDAKCSPKAPTVGTLQTLPACDDADEPFTDTVGNGRGLQGKGLLFFYTRRGVRKISTHPATGPVPQYEGGIRERAGAVQFTIERNTSGCT